MPENLTALMHNKWLLYGSVAAAAVVGYFVLTSGSGGNDSADNSMDAYGYPATLSPVAAGGGYVTPSSGNAADDSTASYLTSLLGLEAKKSDNDLTLGMKSLDNALTTALASISSNFDLGKLQTSALNLSSAASIFQTAQNAMADHIVNAVGLSFQYNGDSFNFESANYLAAYPLSNANANKSLSDFIGITQNGPAVALGNSSTVPFAGAATSQSSGSSAATSTTRGSVASVQSSSASVGTSSNVSVPTGATGFGGVGVRESRGLDLR